MSVCLSVSQSDEGFGGVGEGEANEAMGDRCQSMMGVGPPRFPCTNHLHKALQPSRRVGMTVGSHPPPPSPPNISEKTSGYIEERVFENFQNFREPRFKMSESGFWVFSRQVKE